MAMKRAEASALKSLMKESGWSVLEQKLADHITKLEAEKVVGGNAFEELRALHTKQGKVDGLREFFDMLERGAFDD